MICSFSNETLTLVSHLPISTNKTFPHAVPMAAIALFESSSTTHKEVIFTDTDEINYRVRSGKYYSLEEGQADGAKLPLLELPEKGFWIDNVREEDYSVKKLEYDILE